MIGAEPSFSIFIRDGVSHARKTGYVCRAPGAIGEGMNKNLVQEEFGTTAATYLPSKPHALGKSLERLVALTSPQKGWHVLDVATGGGHVAYAFAPHVARVWATDITQEMLDLVKSEAQKRQLSNVRTAYAKAEALPFEDGDFDLVTCRIDTHHFAYSS